MSIELTKIPGVMRSRGWLNGAQLMERWFAAAPAVAPKYGPPDTNTIKMDDWLLKFRMVRQVFDHIVRERIWTNEPARAQLAKVLLRTGLRGTRGACFNPLSLPVPQLHAHAINFRANSTYYDAPYYDAYYANYYYLGDGMDDVTAALGRFTFHVAVAGDVEGSRVSIRQVGVYIRDSYDFNGSQHLGFWDDGDNSVSAINPLSGSRVTNDDFRNWRDANGRGGDFLVYSDVKRVTLARPDVITLP